MRRREPVIGFDTGRPASPVGHPVHVRNLYVLRQAMAGFDYKPMDCKAIFMLALLLLNFNVTQM